ncbi:MAG: MATE family efflux transporter [Hyphomicrobiales bacterium]|nr:MAG: MATE family efflux transporter [Hyphomicrobiales bacterium]
MPATAKPQITSWNVHIKETLKLGVPLIATQIAQLAIGTTDILIVGRLGTVDLAAIVLASHYFLSIFILGSGFSIAVIPMMAQAVQQGNMNNVARYVRMGLGLSLAFSVVSLPLFQYSELVLLSLGQKPEVVTKAADYLMIAGWAVFPGLSLMVFRALLITLRRANIIFYITVTIFILNAVFAYILVFGYLGAPALGIRGAAITTVAVNFFGLCCAVIYVQFVAETKRLKIFFNLWRPDWILLTEIVRLGFPIGFLLFAEDSLFAVAAIIMGWIGTVELAAHGIAMQLATMAFVVPLGLSQVATVRVGLAAGNNDEDGVFKAAISVLMMTIFTAVFGGFLFVFMRETLVGLFIDPSSTNADELLSVASYFVIVAGIFQLFDGLQIVGAGLLRGIRDTTIPMALAMLSYWLIGFGGAYILAFQVGLGGIGIWFGFLGGLGSAAILLNLRFFLLLGFRRTTFALGKRRLS